MNTTQCEQCERMGREYRRTEIHYDEYGVRDESSHVTRCGYHARNTNYVNYARVSN